MRSGASPEVGGPALGLEHSVDPRSARAEARAEMNFATESVWRPPIQTTTVTRRKVAEINVVSWSGAWLCALKSASSSR